MNANPYLGYGTVATGHRFVGRETLIGRLSDRVMSGAGSTAIVGLARIGKSSLVAELLARTSTTDHAGRRVLLDLSTFANGAEVFAEWYGELTGAFSDATASVHQRFRHLRRYLETNGQSGQVLVLDEFDSVRRYHDGADFLRLLRELLQDPGQTGVAAIVCSRRPVTMIEQQIRDVSTLAGVMEHLTVRPFDQAEFAALLARATTRLTPEWTDVVWRVSGGHPYLAEMGLCVGLQHNGPSKADQYCDQALHYFQHLETFLRDADLLTELVQTVIGPRVSTNRAAQAELHRYGLTRPPGQALSAEFTELLGLAALDLDLWGLFGEAERELRRVIDVVLTQAYGTGYLEVIMRRHKGLAESFAEAERMRQDDIRKFPAARQQGLLHYTYPRQLQELIQAEWAHFKPVMKKDLPYWRQRLDLLSRVRAPFAHSRPEVVPEADIRLTEIYCREILRVADVVNGPDQDSTLSLIR